MIPEVYEVFELLEFHYILKAFETQEEAIKDFERSGLASGSNTKVVAMEKDLRKKSAPVQGESKQQAKDESASLVTIEDRVRKIIAADPDAGTGQIAKLLNSPAFGNVKVGWFGLRRILKNIGLDSKKRREEYSKKAK